VASIVVGRWIMFRYYLLLVFVGDAGGIESGTINIYVSYHLFLSHCSQTFMLSRN
jgi:hypothetical protein